MKEVPFLLQQDDDGWPPVSVEWLWLSEAGDEFLILQPPLFLSDLAVGDRIRVNVKDNDGYVIDWTNTAKSSNSVMWIYDLGDGELNIYLRKFREAGCNTTIMKNLKHASVDIPSSVSRGKIDDILDMIESKAYAIAFPCDRQA